jgi:UDP-glucose 4-epimerase
MPGVTMVTGGLGALGSRVCRELVAGGQRPLVVDSTRDRSRLIDIADQCDFETLDVTDLPNLLTVIRKYEPATIVHMATIIGPGLERQPWAALRVNFMGTATLLECIRLASVPRLIYISSKAVFGEVGELYRSPAYAPVDEAYRREPVTLYGKLKRSCEDLIAHYAGLYGLDVIAFRFSSVFGPGRPEANVGVGSVVDRMADAAFRGVRLEPIRVRSEVKNNKDNYTYVGDIAHAIACGIAAPRAEGSLRPFNICSDIFASVSEMASQLAESHPGWEPPELVTDDNASGNRTGYMFRMSTELARTAIGYQPKYTVHNALADYDSSLARENAGARGAIAHA